MPPVLVLVALAGAAWLLAGKGKGIVLAAEDSSREDIDDEEGGYSMPDDLTEIADALGWRYWYGKGAPGTPWSSGPDGVDCSGFVQMALVRLGRLPSTTIDRSVAGLWSACTEVAEGDQLPGDIAFYPGHVMLVYGAPDASGVSRVIGASGGRSTTLGDKATAYVKLFADHRYRSDFAAFGRLTS